MAVFTRILYPHGLGALHAATKFDIPASHDSATPEVAKVDQLVKDLVGQSLNVVTNILTVRKVAPQVHQLAHSGEICERQDAKQRKFFSERPALRGKTFVRHTTQI